MSFFSELKRRNVFKVGIAYAIVAWLLIQVVSIVLPAYHAPDWVLPILITIISIGFPIAVFLAWAYELTPEGIKPTSKVTAIHASTESIPQTGKEPLLTSAKETNTLAVLPFADLSPDKDQDYFADGLTEELLNKLSQVKDLQVTARTSSFYFKGRNEDMRTIGETLGVAHLLEGSVRKAGDQLRITAQLVKAQDGYHLWSETYDREMTDIFAIQDDIARAVTQALSITLGAGEFKRPGMTRNIEAYKVYLQGVASLYKYTPDSVQTSIDQLKEAVTIDPTFGICWVALCDAYLACLNLLPHGQTVDYDTMTAEAVERARAVAPEIPQLLMYTAGEHDNKKNWPEAERVWKQLLDIHGHTRADVNQRFGTRLLFFGRTSDALRYLQRAKRLDPLSPLASVYLSIALFNSNQVDATLAEVEYFKTLGVFDIGSAIVEHLVAILKNDRTGAAAIIADYHRLNGDYPDATMLRLAELLMMEDEKAALSELRKIAMDSELSPLTRVEIAHVACALEDPEMALKNLRKYQSMASRSAIWHPTFKTMRQLPAFKDYLRELGLVDYWRTTGNWADLCHPVGDDDFECE